MGMILGILGFGILLIAIPIALAAAGISIGGFASAIMVGSGALVSLVGGLALIITKLYVKTKASESFVRTGWGGMEVVQDGGALVIPVVHDLIWVSLETVKLEIIKEGLESLITGDNLRADIRAEFFIRVKDDKDSIIAAARSLGEKMMDPVAVRALVEDKLVSALRSASATKTLNELHANRDDFIEEVTKNVTEDLASNGLMLEAATLSALDMTEVGNLKETNYFDAQGLRNLTEMVEKQKTEKNELVQTNRELRKKRDVTAEKEVLKLSKEEEEARATQQSEVASIQAEQSRAAEQARITAEREVELEEVKKQQALEVAAVKKDQAEEIAQKEKEAALEGAKQKHLLAQVAKEQAEAVARQEKQEAVVRAEEKKALADAEKAKAEVAAETEQQKIKTVEVVETAKRDKQHEVIQAEAKAETAFVQEQREADAKAYKVEKDASARKMAADADAEAITKKARAESTAVELKAKAEQVSLEASAAGNKAKVLAEADGKRALEMIPVDMEEKRIAIKAQEVLVDKQRVEEVVVPDLTARAEFGEVDLRHARLLLTIEKKASVQVAAAQAVASIGGKFEGQIFGTPQDVEKMTMAYMRGLGVANGVEGFMDGADDVEGMLGENLTKLIGTVGAIGSHLGIPEKVAGILAPVADPKAEKPEGGNDVGADS
jgi:flotillin